MEASVDNEQIALDALLGTMQDCFFWADRQGIVRLVSPSVSRLLGYTPEEVVGRVVNEFFARQPAASKFLAALKDNKGNLQGYECDLQRKDGSQVPVKFHTNYYFDAGLHKGTVGTIVDISRENYQRNLLEESVESLSEAFALYDEDDRLLMMNEAYRRYYDLHADVFRIGRSFEEMLWIGVERGQFPDAVGREEEWVRQRVQAHRNPTGYLEQQLGPDKWLKVTESKTPSGCIAGLRIDISEMKRAEAAVQKSEANLREVIECSPIGVSVIAYPSDGVFGEQLFTNRALLEMFGVEDKGARSDTDISDTWTDRAQFDVATEILASGRDLDDFQSQRRRGDGAIIWVSMNSRILEFEEKRCLMTWFSDITAHKEYEKALIESEQMLAMAQALAHIGSWDTDLKRDTFFLSEEAYRIYGIDEAQEGVSRDYIMNMTHPEDRGQVQEMIERSVQAGSPYLLEHRILRPDGKTRWVEQRGATILNDKGAPIHFSGTIQDITERKVAELALRESEERIAAMVALSPDAVITCDEDLQVTTFNKGAEVIFGYDEAEILGQSLELLIPDRFRPGHDRYVDAFARSRDSNLKMENRGTIYALHRDGHEFPAEVSISKLAIGAQNHFTVILRDVSKRMEAQIQLIKARDAAELANRTKSEFLANMSHELRTPLNAIIGFSDLLESGLYGELNDRQVSYVRDVKSAGAHLLSLINDILDLSKVEAGEFQPYLETVDAGKVIGEAVRLVIERAREADLQLTSEMPEEAIICQCDERILKQILANLLSNAVKFTPAGGRVTVALTRAGTGGYRISVKDTGIGMSPEEIEQAATPFGQVESPFTRSREGTGLGLPLVLAHVNSLGGEVEINSKPGAGTEVAFTLPFDPPVGKRRSSR